MDLKINIDSKIIITLPNNIPYIKPLREKSDAAVNIKGAKAAANDANIMHLRSTSPDS